MADQAQQEHPEVQAPAEVQHEVVQAAKEGDLEAVQAAVEANPTLVNATDPRRRSSLHVAAKEGHVEVVQYLLENGANPQATDASGNTPADVAHNDEIKQMIETATQKTEEGEAAQASA